MSSLATTRTARTITTAAKGAVPGSRWETTSQGPYSFRVILRDAAGLDAAVVARAAALAVERLGDFTVSWGTARSARGTQLVMTITDEAVRSAELEAATLRRDETLARELGYASVEDYRNAPGRTPAPIVIERVAISTTDALAALEPEAAELSEQAQRTVAEMAAAREEEPAEHRAFRERMEATAADRQRAEGERNARLMAHRTAMREQDRTGLVTAPREDTGYPPYTTAEAVELAHAGLSLLSDHGGSYAHTVRQGGHLGRVLGRVQCITDEEDLTTVRFGAYRPDGSRVGIADSRPEAARLLRPAAEASTGELPFVDVIARHGKPIYVACAADGTAVSEHPSRALAEHAVRHLPPVELTPAVVTLTNPELWVETTRYRNGQPYTETRPAAEVTRYRGGAPA